MFFTIAASDLLRRLGRFGVESQISAGNALALRTAGFLVGVTFTVFLFALRFSTSAFVFLWLDRLEKIVYTNLKIFLNLRVNVGLEFKSIFDKRSHNLRLLEG